MRRSLRQTFNLNWLNKKVQTKQANKQTNKQTQKCIYHLQLLLSFQICNKKKKKAQISEIKMTSVQIGQWGVVRLFKMRGRQGGLMGVWEGADWDSKWWLSIDLCTKCNFIWGVRGHSFCQGAVAPCPLAMPLAVA